MGILALSDAHTHATVLAIKARRAIDTSGALETAIVPGAV